MLTRITHFGFCVCLVVAGFAVTTSSGCSRETEAQKLEAPEGIDWAAIEAEGSEMAETQDTGE